MIIRLVLVVLALAAVLGGIFGWKYLQGQQMAAMMSAPPPPATIAAAEVRAETWEPYLYAVGSLVATQGVDVTTEVAGQVRSIAFESGQAVEQGSLLLQLDDSVDQADLRGLQAERRLAEIRYKRFVRLVKDNSASQADLDEAQANLQNLEAQVAAEQATIDKKRIRAPFAGLLGIRQVDLGEYLAPGSRIVPLQALDPIYVDYALPERHIASLRPGQPVLIGIQAYGDETFQGSITALNPGIDPRTRNLRVRATLPNPDGRLRPGMFADVRTVLPARSNVLTVPRTAISYNPYGDSVFVIEQQDGQAVVQRRQIETGDSREGRVEVLAGLSVGETVVSAGHVKLRNGQPVVVDDSVALDRASIGP
jgi:membrane fusion protein (multidrug efflux system)